MQVASASMAGGQPPEGHRSMYSTPSEISIIGGTHTMVNGPSFSNYNVTTIDRQWIRDLRSHTATGAFHNSGERYDAPKCHPQTRVAVIKEIMTWVRDPNRVEQFLWIYGPAGSGKSSIAQTIAELCEEEGTLASDFFFSRTAPGRNTETNLIATLACQLITTTPRIYAHMEAMINHDPLIFSRSISTQLSSLILHPIAQLLASGPQEKSHPHVVIIDGLDECGKPESQHYILSSIYSALQKSAVRLTFIIASRPEQIIRDTFNGDLNSHTRSLVLDDKYFPNDDIRVFLTTKFEEIRQKHPLARYLPSDWPSSADMDYLISKASGQFIYASTVVKFVDSPRDRPTDRLKIVKNASPRGHKVPFAELDELYKAILSEIDPSTLEQVLDIFGFILANAEIDSGNLPLYGTETLETFLHCQPGDVTILLADLHSIVDFRRYGVTTFFHASLGDFFRDKSRSGSFFIDMGLYSAKMVRLCIGHIERILEEEKLPTPDDELRDFNPIFSFASKAFVQLFAVANPSPDDMLLHELSLFPLDEYLEANYKHFLLYSFLPSLFEWIYRQNVELHGRYTALYDDFLRKDLSVWLWNYCTHYRNPSQYSVLTALTLEVKHNNYSTVLFFMRHMYDCALRSRFFRNPPTTDLSGSDDCICRLVKFATESDASGHCWADTSKYVDLALHLFETFENIPAKKKEHPLEPAEYEIIGLELLSASLKRIPKEPSVYEYLTSNRGRVFEYFDESGRNKLQLLIENYIQEFGQE